MQFGPVWSFFINLEPDRSFITGLAYLSLCFVIFFDSVLETLVVCS